MKLILDQSLILKILLKTKLSLRVIISLSITFIISISSYSQELEPRNYSVIPKDLNALVIGYSFASGGIVTDATSPFQDFKIISHTLTTGYVRTFGIFGKLGKVQIAIPFAYMSGGVKVNGHDTSGTRTGFGDARLRIGVNVFGSPALSKKDFQRFKEEMVLGASLVLSIPTGQYDKAKLVNLGSNRWGFKPEIGFSYAYKRFYFELYSGVWLFTNNYDFLQTKTLKQDPIYSLQANVIYIFPFHLWVGLDGNYFFGGKSQINGIYQNDEMKNSRFGGVVGVPLSVHHSFKLQVHTGVATYSGAGYTVLTLAYQYLWP